MNRLFVLMNILLAYNKKNNINECITTKQDTKESKVEGMGKWE